MIRIERHTFYIHKTGPVPVHANLNNPVVKKKATIDKPDLNHFPNPLGKHFAFNGISEHVGVQKFAGLPEMHLFSGKKLHPFCRSPTPLLLPLVVLLCCWWQFVLRFLHNTHPSVHIFDHSHLLHTYFLFCASVNKPVWRSHPLPKNTNNNDGWLKPSTAKKHKHYMIDDFAHLSYCNYRWSSSLVTHDCMFIFIADCER